MKVPNQMIRKIPALCVLRLLIDDLKGERDRISQLSRIFFLEEGGIVIYDEAWVHH